MGNPESKKKPMRKIVIPTKEGTVSRKAIQKAVNAVAKERKQREEVVEKMDVYEKIGLSIGELVGSKQRQYGKAFNKADQILRVLYPDGVKPHQYQDMLCITRILDKLFRIAQRGEDGCDLGGESPYRDITGYGILGTEKDEQ